MNTMKNNSPEGIKNPPAIPDLQRSAAQEFYGAKRLPDGRWSIPYEQGYNYKRIAGEVRRAALAIAKEQAELQRNTTDIEVIVEARKSRRGRNAPKMMVSGDMKEVNQEGVDSVMQRVKNALGKVESGAIIIQRKEEPVQLPTVDFPQVEKQPEASNLSWSVSVPASWRPAFAAILGVLNTIGTLMQFRPRK